MADTLTPAYAFPTFKIDDVAGMTDALHEDGFALIPNVLSAQEVQDVRDAIDRLKPFGFDKMGKTEHYKCVFNRERTFFDLIDREGVVDLAEATMGSQCHIIGETAWKSHPGHNGWGPHTDHTLVTVPEETASDRKAFPIYLCTAHYYLDDLDETLAPTYVIPGSHKSGRSLGGDKDPEWKGEKMKPVLCKAGDVLFFRSEVWHSGSENASDRIRYLLQVHYSHRTIAQRFSPWPFSFNQELLAAANERQLRLLGKHPEAAYG
jgi:ectoine hydroxylase-related dioxygenase (phytanoyl-CoA dioxygenase family)